MKVEINVFRIYTECHFIIIINFFFIYVAHKRVQNVLRKAGEQMVPESDLYLNIVDYDWIPYI